MADRPEMRDRTGPAAPAMLPDEAVEAALRELASELAVPAGAALPALVRARAEAMPVPYRAPWWSRRRAGSSSLGRGAVLAAALVLVAAAVAGAATLGLPGLQILFGPTAPPSISPTVSAPAGTATPGPMGGELPLGSPVGLEGIDAVTGFPVAIPTDPRLGPPDAVWWEPTLGRGQVALVWASGPGLPAIAGDKIGAILTETPGRTDEGFVQKVLGPGSTVEPVTVAGAPGFWISGEPHEFLYITPEGEVVQDSRRVVGDTLTWWADGTLYRLESGLGLEAAIEVAESLE